MPYGQNDVTVKYFPPKNVPVWTGPYREEGYKKLVNQLTTLEQQHKSNKDDTVLQQIISVRREIDDVLRLDAEKKLKFIKQTYYESGCKSTKYLARGIKA